MPRQPRLEAPDALPHVRVRGLEHRGIVRDDPDRTACVARLAALVEGGAGTVYAWAVLPTHAHLLVRTGTRPLARSLRRRLTGDAGAVNRCHQRGGHLFQNTTSGSRSSAIPKAARRGATQAPVWRRLLTETQ